MAGFFNIDSPFMQGLNKLADLLILNLLTIIFFVPAYIIGVGAMSSVGLFEALLMCVPLTFPCGAAITALNYMVLKIVRDEETYIVKGYFKSFKLNFKQATAIWYIGVAVVVLLAFDFKIIAASAQDVPEWLPFGLIAVSVIVYILGIHAFPLLAKFDNTVFKTIKNSVLVGLMTFPKTVLMAAICALPLAIVFFFEKQMAPILILLGFSGPAFLCALLYNKTFKKLEPQPEVVEDPDAWFIEPIEDETDDSASKSIKEDEGDAPELDASETAGETAED